MWQTEEGSHSNAAYLCEPPEGTVEFRAERNHLNVAVADLN